MKDYSQYILDGIGLINLPDVDLINDVRELRVTAWPISLPYLYNSYQGFPAGEAIREYRTFHKPFVATGNSDGSYNVNVRYREYQLQDQPYQSHILIDYDNDDPKGSAPKLIRVNIAVTAIGDGNYNLIFNDPYREGYFNGASSGSDYQYLIRSLYDSEGNVLFPNRIIYYTLDGSTPTTESNIYDPNNIPVLLAGETYIVKVFSVCPYWQDSEIQTDTIVVDSLFKNNYAAQPNFSLSGPVVVDPFTFYSFFIFNSDSLLTGYEDIRLSLSLPDDSGIPEPSTRVIYYSLDSGINYQEYTEPLALPTGWKTPVGNAGFPVVLFNLRDSDGNRSPQNEGFISFIFLYPNNNLNLFGYVFSSGTPYQGEALNINGNSFTFGPSEYRLTVTPFLIQKIRTVIDDFRYFELKVDALTDPTKQISLFVNQIQLDQNGNIYNTFNINGSYPGDQDGVYPELAWGEGDVIRVRFNYSNGSIQLAVNGNELSVPILAAQTEIGFYIAYTNYDNTTEVNGSSFTFNFKAADFIYPINDLITLPFDTST